MPLSACRCYTLRRNSPRTSHPCHLTLLPSHPLTSQTTQYIQSGRFPRAKRVVPLLSAGIRSLSVTHEQVIIGWIGDIESPNTTSGTSNSPLLLIPFSYPFRLDHPRFISREKITLLSMSLSEQDKAALEDEIANSRVRTKIPKLFMFCSCWTIRSLMATTTVTENKVRSLPQLR